MASLPVTSIPSDSAYIQSLHFQTDLLLLCTLLFKNISPWKWNKSILEVTHTLSTKLSKDIGGINWLMIGLVLQTHLSNNIVWFSVWCLCGRREIQKSGWRSMHVSSKPGARTFNNTGITREFSKATSTNKWQWHKYSRCVSWVSWLAWCKWSAPPIVLFSAEEASGAVHYPQLRYSI